MRDEGVSKYGTAENRWAGVGPYYAMFPTSFADAVIALHSEQGDGVLDPFSGRGTTLYSAAIAGRHGIGIELNPVGWVYAATKLAPAPSDAVSKRVKEIAGQASHFRRTAASLPEFFTHCFAAHVRRFLMASRQLLDWRRCRVDRTVMALLLVNLHGKRDASFSNQLRQTKAMSPDYAVTWWKERRLAPPDVDPVEFLNTRIEWRYAKGVPSVTRSWPLLGNSVDRLTHLRRVREERGIPKASLLLTSPPYYAKTNYFYDQWLRLWLLGGPPNALRIGGAYRDKFEHRERYAGLLRKVFTKSATLLKRNAVVYVRTGKQQTTLETTEMVLKEVFPRKMLQKCFRPFSRPTQTQLFGDEEIKEGEVDLILAPKA